MRARELGALAGLLLLGAALWAATPHFATVDNLLNVAEQTAIVGVLAAGMTFVILTGGIDLSVGSVVALAASCSGSRCAPARRSRPRSRRRCSRARRAAPPTAPWSRSAACRPSSSRSG
jgi:hypothetical protein